MKHSLVLIFLILAFQACKKTPSVSDAVKKVDVNVKIDRFDSVFAQASPDDLPKLKHDYPFLFSRKYPDSIWFQKMRDTLQQQLNAETEKAFSDFSQEKQDLVLFFKHLKYHFPNFRPPRIVTVVSNVDYRNKVIVTDSIMLLALDTYLGKNHRFYQGISKYISQNLSADQILPDVAAEYAKKYIYQPQRKTLLDEMIYYGKILYFKDIMLPLVPDADKMGYTQQQLEWAQANESEIWRYFIAREMLYDTDSSLPGRFINPAPFSKFYLELDNQSPGRLGQYIGWQIVRSYMKNNTVDLHKMLETSPDEIFKNSKFKPRK